MERQHKQIRLLMVLVYIAFAFAFRIAMLDPSKPDTHIPDLVGDLTMNYDIQAEILGARSIIDGTFNVYTGRYFVRVVPPSGSPLGYPPLMFYLQAPFVFLGQKIGWAPFSFPMFALCGVPYIILSTLCVLQMGVVLKKNLKVEDEMTITVITFLLLFSSLMFWAVTFDARFDFVAALFLLLAMSEVASERFGRAGICVGLALMTKQTVVPPLLAFGAVILVSTLRGEIAFRKTFKLSAATLIPFSILIPFWIASPHDLRLALIETVGQLAITKGTFINGVLEIGKLAFPEEPLRGFLRFHSNSIILALCLVFIFTVAIKKKIMFGTMQFCALVTIAAFIFPILGKVTNISHYVAISTVFLLLWGASRETGFPHDPVFFIVLQSFILDHCPIIWKQYVGLIFYALASIYIYFMTFSVAAKPSITQAGQNPGG